MFLDNTCGTLTCCYYCHFQSSWVFGKFNSTVNELISGWINHHYSSAIKLLFRWLLCHSLSQKQLLPFKKRQSNELRLVCDSVRFMFKPQQVLGSENCVLCIMTPDDWASSVFLKGTLQHQGEEVKLHIFLIKLQPSGGKQPYQCSVVNKTSPQLFVRPL